MILKLCVLVALLLLSICNDQSLGDASVCGNWMTFKDEWCYKILDETFRTFSEAQASCGQLEGSPTLPIIHTKEEQEFLSDYLFKISRKNENFWIGAKFSESSKKFQWIDNSELTFANWDSKGTRNLSNYCVQMQRDQALAIGKWIDEPCETKKNLVVCQKMQTWSLALLQKTLLETRKELKTSEIRIKNDEENHLATKKELIDSLNSAQNHIESLEQDLVSAKSDLSSSLETAKTRIHTLEQNPVPIGFIYVQLYGQPEPKPIWPSVGWTQVTSSYAGEFFRAEGGGSAAFGTIQQGDAPKLTNVESVFMAHSKMVNAATCSPGHWSPWILSGGPGGPGDHNSLKFFVSNAEVRPRNQAVRIWRRDN